MTAAHTTETRPAEQWRRGREGVDSIDRIVPDEAPVGISYDGKPHVVLMASPADLEDLAIGFTVTEGIARASDVETVTVSVHPEGVQVDIVLSEHAKKAVASARKRTLEGRSSCGLCGVQRLKSAVRSLAPLNSTATFERTALQAALDAMEPQQTLGNLTRATHAAAWADRDGNLLVVREDVGRHNALDKVIGAALRAGLDPANAFAVVTSRCSYEMVEKTAIAGLSLMVAVSAPTALAIRKAEEAGLTLVALARADGHMVFTRPDRVLDGVLA